MKRNVMRLACSFATAGICLWVISGCEKGNLPDLTTSDVTEIAQSTANCGGNVTDDGGYAITERGVCWSMDPEPCIDNSRTTDGNGAGAFVSNLTGLMSNTTYYVRAYASNEKGTGYGNEKTFATPEACEMNDIVDNWSGTAKNAQYTINLSLTVSPGGSVSGSGVNSHWSITAEGEITGGGTFSFISGSSYIVASAGWNLQFNSAKQQITGIFDIYTSGLHDMQVVLNRS